MDQKSLQIQSVIYNTEKEHLNRTICHLCNAIRVERENGGHFGAINLIYGDASPSPIFTDEEILELQNEYKEYLNIDYRVFGFNSGTAKGHNLLSEHCTTDYIMIMNPDIILSPRTLIELYRPFADPQVGIVEARQTPVEHQKEYDTTTFETAWASTACTMIRTDVLHEVGGFDADTFFMYCDDVDFSWQVRLAGYKVIYQPLAPVYHAKRLTNGGKWIPTSAEVYYSAEAALLMAHKWSNPKLVQTLLTAFETGTAEQQKAAAEFNARKAKGTLPTPIDHKHEVSQFYDGFYYAKNRFVL